MERSDTVKAILVLNDMPSKCRDCQFYYQTHDENDDYVRKCEVLNDMTIDGFIDKYSGCPLKPMPSEKNEDKAYTMTQLYRTQGYNACIDEILGDKE